MVIVRIFIIFDAVDEDEDSVNWLITFHRQLARKLNGYFPKKGYYCKEGTEHIVLDYWFMALPSEQQHSAHIVAVVNYMFRISIFIALNYHLSDRKCNYMVSGFNIIIVSVMNVFTVHVEGAYVNGL